MANILVTNSQNTSQKIKKKTNNIEQDVDMIDKSNDNTNKINTSVSNNCDYVICNACNNKLNPCMTVIQCVECKSSKVIICIKCFKKGIEFNQHKRFHRYYVLPGINVSMNENNTNNNNNSDKIWSLKDIWNLHAAIKKFGIGNWSKIAKFINNPSLTKKIIEQFVLKQYENSDNNEQLMEIDEKTTESQEKILSNTKSRKKRSRRSNKSSISSKTKREMENNDKLLKCGYNPKRKEFEVKWNNNSEQILSEMFLSEYDTKDERELKLEGIRLYNESVLDRERRKKYILSPKYGVLHGLNEKYIKKERHKEIFDNIAKFSRFAENKQQFRTLVDGLIEEKELRDRVKKIKYYLMNGVTSIEQMNKIEKYYKLNENDTEKYSLEMISQHLRMEEKKEAIYSKKRSNRRLNKEMEEKQNECDVEMKVEFDVGKYDGHDVLNVGEKRLCEVLKIPPNGYKYIQKRISGLVKKHMLSKNGNMPTQIYIDIDDNLNVEESTDVEIGLVNPQTI
eukprot:15484_1